MNNQNKDGFQNKKYCHKTFMFFNDIYYGNQSANSKIFSFVYKAWIRFLKEHQFIKTNISGAITNIKLLQPISSFLVK